MYHHRSQSAIPSNFQHKIKTYHQRSISEVPLNSSNVTKSSTPKTSTLMDGRIDFIFEIHLPFMINLLNRIIQERDSLYEKTDFDKEPVGLNYWVYSKGIQSLKREGRFICCEIPIELKVVKLVSTLLGDYEVEANFSFFLDYKFQVILILTLLIFR